MPQTIDAVAARDSPSESIRTHGHTPRAWRSYYVFEDYIGLIALRAAGEAQRNFLGTPLLRSYATRVLDYFAALGAGLVAGVLNCTVSATSLPSVGSLA